MMSENRREAMIRRGSERRELENLAFTAKELSLTLIYKSQVIPLWPPQRVIEKGKRGVGLHCLSVVPLSNRASPLLVAMRVLRSKQSS